MTLFSQMTFGSESHAHARRKEVRARTIAMVLATDLGVHFQTWKKFWRITEHRLRDAFNGSRPSEAVTPHPVPECPSHAISFELAQRRDALSGKTPVFMCPMSIVT